MNQCSGEIQLIAYVNSRAIWAIGPSGAAASPDAAELPTYFCFSSICQYLLIGGSHVGGHAQDAVEEQKGGGCRTSPPWAEGGAGVEKGGLARHLHGRKFGTYAAVLFLIWGWRTDRSHMPRLTICSKQLLWWELNSENTPTLQSAARHTYGTMACWYIKETCCERIISNDFRYLKWRNPEPYKL